MPQEPDQHSDPTAASVSLAAEATLLECRLRLLQEEIDTVDARIKAVSDALRLLRRTSSASDSAAETSSRGVSAGSPSVPTFHKGTAYDVEGARSRVQTEQHRT